MNATDAEDHAAARSLAYAAVTARINNDHEMMTDHVYELVRGGPVLMALGMLALVHTCQGLVYLCASGTDHTTQELWRVLASEVALAAINEEGADE